MTDETTPTEDIKQREFDYFTGKLDAAIEIVAKLERVFGERAK